jgi:hypothetical protein
MAKGRGRKRQAIPMIIGKDPDLWRYDSVEAAIEDSIDLFTQLIRAGDEPQQQESATPEVSAAPSVSIEEGA